MSVANIYVFRATWELKVERFIRFCTEAKEGEREREGRGKDNYDSVFLYVYSFCHLGCDTGLAETAVYDIVFGHARCYCKINVEKLSNITYTLLLSLFIGDGPCTRSTITSLYLKTVHVLDSKIQKCCDLNTPKSGSISSVIEL